MTDWINIKDELPEFDQPILVAHKDYVVVAGFFHGEVITYVSLPTNTEKDEWELDHIKLDDVLYWTPAPTHPLIEDYRIVNSFIESFKKP